MEDIKRDPFVLENFKGEGDIIILDKKDLNELMKNDSFKKIIAYYKSAQNKKSSDFISDMDALWQPGRAVGNSTRQADKIIQLLFEYRGNWIPVIDHGSLQHAPNRRYEISQYLVDMITNRIKSEHRWKGVASTLKHQIVHTNRIDTYIVKRDYFSVFLDMYRNRTGISEERIHLLCLPK